MRPTESSRIHTSQLGREIVCFALAFGGGPDISPDEITSKVHNIVSDAILVRNTPYGPIFGLASEVDLLVLIRSGPVITQNGRMIGFCPPVEFEGLVQYAAPYRQISVYQGPGEVVLYIVSIVIFAFCMGALVNGTTLVRHIAIALCYMLSGLAFLYIVFVAARLISQRHYAHFW